MASQPLARISEEEYLATERAAEERSEYVEGEVFVKPPASWRRGQLTVAIAGELHSRLDRSRWRTFGPSLRVYVPARMYGYSDVGVVCGRPLFVDDRQDTLLNPVLLIEISPDSTRDFDMGAKFPHYRRLESLQDFLFVDQDAPHIEHWERRPDGLWSLRDHDGLDAEVKLASVGCSLPLARIYRDLDPPSA